MASKREKHFYATFNGLPFHLRKHLTRSRTIAADYEEKLLHLTDFYFICSLLQPLSMQKKLYVCKKKIVVYYSSRSNHESSKINYIHIACGCV